MSWIDEVQREAVEIAAEDRVDDGPQTDLVPDENQLRAARALKLRREEAIEIVKQVELDERGIPQMRPCKHNNIPFPGDGIDEEMSMEEYHRVDAFNASTGKAFHNYGLMGAAYLEGEPDPPTNNMLFGTACHARILEPELYKTHAELGIDNKSKPLADNCTWEKHAQAVELLGRDKIILHTGWAERIERVHEAIMRHSLASIFFEDPNLLREVTIFWTERFLLCGVVMNVPCKARIDLFSPKHQCTIDLKMAASIAPFGFEKTVDKLGYYQSAGWYTRAVLRSTLLRLNQYGKYFGDPYLFLAAEPDPIRKSSSLHLCAVYSLSEAVLSQGYDELMVTGMSRYLTYRISGHAEGPVWANGVTPIQIPQYKMSDEQPTFMIGS